MNKLTIIGNLTRDPETNKTNSGMEYVKFGVAVQRKFKKDDGTHETDFFNCTAWGKIGTDVIAKYCKKGEKIAITGRIESNKKDDKTYWDVTVEDVELIGGKKTETETEKIDLKPVDDDTLPF